MKLTIEGKVYVAREDDINTDLIIPARYLNTSDPKELAKHAMEDLDPKRHQIPFLNRDGSCDYKILITGKNFGCGSSREHAVWALAAAGIEAVIAPSPVPFARIFYRNCINEGGVLPLECDESGKLGDYLKTGESISIDMSEERPVLTRANEAKMLLRPFTGIAREIMDAGGLTAYNKRKLTSLLQ
jgi:3-isopropylmalate/(R)-2-methylmalate dehydratase small subunit